MRSFADVNVSRFITILPILFLLAGCECSDRAPGVPEDMCVAVEPTSTGGDSSSGDPTTTGRGDCCEEHGSFPDAPGICAVSEAPVCVGCDGEPVLCMTHGCAVPNVKDCCLDRAGVTVVCPG
jgi:hypothetical protein